MRADVRKLSRVRSVEALADRCAELGIALPIDPEIDSGPDAPLARPFDAAEHRVGNRFAILPMEGWDATRDGRPTDLVRRRWRRFGASGAKLVWGGEAVAVRPDGRANPNQLVIDAERADGLRSLREELVRVHEERFGTSADLLVGLQLTHSGRFARPDGDPRPLVAYRHPELDERLGDTEPRVLADEELDALVDAFVLAARCARDAGFDFVDVKHCHGYLGHELLSGVERPGRYGGDFAGRTRWLGSVLDGIRAEAPDLEIGVRLSIFDFAPFEPGSDGVGVPSAAAGAAYPRAFGGAGTGLGIDLDEPSRLLTWLSGRGVRLVCTTAGSPYYCPHVQRPAFFPPSDGYRPPEDPLVGVARQVAATAELAERHPELRIVGSAYSYLQEWLPHVAQAVVREGRATSVGIGRMALSYPELPADVLAGRPLARARICRTFSDCTTAPRHGLISGCYPLDAHYRKRDEASALAAVKRAAVRAGEARSGT